MEDRLSKDSLFFFMDLLGNLLYPAPEKRVMEKEKIIVLGGGVGPLAGTLLHRRIIENTLTNGTDQTHLEVHHYSRSPDIPDRTAYLLGEEPVNPAEGMARSFMIAYQATLAAGKDAVGGVPCNTFHAPEIFGRFLSLLQEGGIQIKILHMLEETLSFVNNLVSPGKRLGLLATTGTRKTEVYNRLFLSRGREIVDIPWEAQEKIHEAIYNRTWGIKAKTPVTEQAHSILLEAACSLQAREVGAIILGCTEIPLALEQRDLPDTLLVDPLTALARALIFEANPRKLLPL